MIMIEHPQGEEINGEYEKENNTQTSHARHEQVQIAVAGLVKKSTCTSKYLTGVTVVTYYMIIY